MNYLTLVNKENLIKDNYFKCLELIDYHDVLSAPIKVEKATLESYLQLKNFLEKKNIEIGIDSSYRTIEEQQKIIDEFELKYGEEYTKKYVASVRTSEHHTGLAVDLSIKVNNEFLIESKDLMINENIYLEIHKYLKDFGFILRYPKEKENITGYSYEPWHIRYVGKIPAKIIYENNLCLEEYLNSYSGILLVNKEKNMTSRDVVNQLSKLLGIKKIGHTGTLDPMAEGVLVLTIGRATKLGELLTATSKEYIAGVSIGKLTDTLDTTGDVIKEKECHKNINYKELLSAFQKTYLQEVPIYSAVKVKGKKLYEYARNNKEIELPKKEVTIKEINLLESNKNSFKFKCLVTKGTYIRSLIRDMGQSIDEYFSMSSLIRTKQGKFSIEDSYYLDDIKDNKFKILSIEEVLNDYKTIIVDDKLKKKIINGSKINNTYDIKDKILFKDKNNKLIAIYQRDKEYLKMYKMMIDLSIYNSYNK